MISYAQALTLMSSLPRSSGGERVQLAHAAGRILAADLIARVPSPPFTNSAMDGFAFRHADIAHGPLTIGPTLLAGSAGRRAFEHATNPALGAPCVRIMTGAEIPAWVDTVVPLEDAGDVAAGRLTLLMPPAKGSNIRYAGEDVAEGQKILPEGTRLDPERIMVAAAFGYDSVTVRARPDLILCTTGDEIVEPGLALPPGGVYNSNRYFLAAAAQAIGIPVTRSISISDDEEAAVHVFAQNLDPDRSQILITTGAVSAGDADFIPRLAARMGFTLSFHRVAVRPGKPVFVATRGKSVWLGLPGNPLAACTGWYYFARPILRRMAGLPLPAKRTLTLSTAVNKPEALRCFFRADVDGDTAIVAAKQGSAHFAPSFTNSAYVDLPEGFSHIPASTRVEAIIV